MPAESREHHSHVDPRDGDSAYFFIIFLTNFKNRAWRFVHIIEVIKTVGIIEILVSRFQSLMKRKARTITVDWQVGSIFYCYFVLLGDLGIFGLDSFDQFPVFVF